MVLNIKRLISEQKYEGEIEFTFPPDEELIVLPLSKIAGDIAVKGSYLIYDDDAVQIRLTMSYDIEGECSYCLKQAVTHVEYEIDEVFLPYKDEESYYYLSGRLDLTELLRDSVLVSQPSVLLCEEGCQGIDI